MAANTSAIRQRAAHTAYHHLLAAKQEPYKKAYLLPNNTGEFPGPKSGERDICRQKFTSERANKTGGRKGEPNKDSPVIPDSREHHISQTSGD